MALVVGTDEAGYGPYLGPLVITATAWRVPDECLASDLYERLSGIVARPTSAAPKRRRSSDSAGSRRLDPILIGDSKLVYRAGAGLDALERSVLALLGTFGEPPRTWSDAWRRIAPECNGALTSMPWYCGFDHELPAVCELDEILHAGRRCRAGFEQAGIELAAVRSRAIFPSEWNGLLERGGGKAEILSCETLRLVRRMLDEHPDPQVLVHCDKHGGRNHYAALIQSIFPDEWVEVRSEARDVSCYRLRSAGREFEFRFVMQGEGHLACAVASMTSKYLRELAMRAFNEFWCTRLPGLRPTAGYPTDAHRFRSEIAQLQKQLGICDADLWRMR